MHLKNEKEIYDERLKVNEDGIKKALTTASKYKIWDWREEEWDKWYEIVMLRWNNKLNSIKSAATLELAKNKSIKIGEKVRKYSYIHIIAKYH